MTYGVSPLSVGGLATIRTLFPKLSSAFASHDAECDKVAMSDYRVRSRATLPPASTALNISTSIPATCVPVRSVRNPIAYGPTKPPIFAIVISPHTAAAIPALSSFVGKAQ